jgi:hypothetical protein
VLLAKAMSGKLRKILKVLLWIQSGFPTPAPDFVKHKVLMRHGKSDAWIETGTYLGDTTKFLAKSSKIVYSLEPSQNLYLDAKRRFQASPIIKIVKGTSEEKLREVISLIIPLGYKHISFWLDGHYSAGNTYQGPNDTPVIIELEIISEYLNSALELTIFIDDVRCFNSNLLEYASYPSLHLLIDWCKSNQMSWNIEHDILIIKNKRS